MLVPVCVCACMYVHVCVCAHACVCVCVCALRIVSRDKIVRFKKYCIYYYYLFIFTHAFTSHIPGTYDAVVAVCSV